MRLHSLTSSFLILLYGIVGLTGESLHYLVQEGFTSDQGVVQDSVDTEHTHGYHHCHGPDYHWHYHAPHHTKQKDSDSKNSEHSKAKPQPVDPHEVAYRIPGATHSAHACPLLALVASMRLGIGGTASFGLACLPLGLLEINYEESLAPEAVQLKFARGPPSRLFA